MRDDPGVDAESGGGQDVEQQTSSPAEGIASDVEQILERLPPEEAQVVIRTIEQVASWQAPLPPPEMRDGFEQVVPGAAERIFAMAEREQTHRHGIEERMSRIPSRGQIFAFIIAMTVVLAGVVLIAVGHSTIGLVAVLGPLAGLLAAFLVTRSS